MSQPYRAKSQWYRLRDFRLFVEPYKRGVPVRRIAEETRYSETHIVNALKLHGVWEGKSAKISY